MLVSGNRRKLLAEIAFGVAASAIAFLATWTLSLVIGETYFDLIAAAIALVCWRRGWRTGVASAITGLAAVLFLLPPVFSMRIDSASDAITVSAFAVMSAVICVLAHGSDRSTRRLNVVETKWRDSEQWLQAAQQFTRFWTWELDRDRKLLKWANPYGELKSQEYAPLDSCLAHIHPQDRERCRAAFTKAAEGDSLALDFRMNGPSGERHLIARGMHSHGSHERRLIGVSVELDDRGGQETELALHGIDDLLGVLQENPTLDRNARLNVLLAHNVIARLLTTPDKRLSTAS